MFVLWLVNWTMSSSHTGRDHLIITATHCRSSLLYRGRIKAESDQSMLHIKGSVCWGQAVCVPVPAVSLEIEVLFPTAVQRTLQEQLAELDSL